MAKLDDISWHMDSAGSPEETAELRGGTHMGFFLHWAVLSGYWRGLPEEDGEAEVAPLKRGEMTGTEFLIERYDGKLLTQAFTDEGAAMAKKYYDQYCSVFQKVITQCGYVDYQVPDTPEMFERVCQAIREDRAAMASKPWWRFW